MYGPDNHVVAASPYNPSPRLTGLSLAVIIFPVYPHPIMTRPIHTLSWQKKEVTHVI